MNRYLAPRQPDPVNIESIRSAAKRIKSVAHKTPVLTSRTADEQVGASVFFKCENYQRAGAFKFRGAYNALSQLDQKGRKRGILTYSSGNHAQAIALAGKLLGIPSTIIMPSDAPQIKREATQGYGASILLYDKSKTTRETLAKKISQEQGLEIIPPFDHPDVISGQGTVAVELIEEAGDLDYLLVCCGGGGLLSGCAVAARALSPYCKVIGVEPKNGNDATRSFYSGLLQSVYNPNTIADGARTFSLGTHTFPLVLENVDDMLTVSEAEIVDAMRFLYERMKIVVEPTGALAAAALLSSDTARFSNSRIGVIISGGNVDLMQLGKYFNA